MSGEILLFSAGFFWLRRLAAFDLPGRFLTGRMDVT